MCGFFIDANTLLSDFRRGSAGENDLGKSFRAFWEFLIHSDRQVYVVNNQLTGQLSKLISDQGRAENKRILELISGIERKALALALDGCPYPEKIPYFMVSLRFKAGSIRKKSAFGTGKNYDFGFILDLIISCHERCCRICRSLLSELSVDMKLCLKID